MIEEQKRQLTGSESRDVFKQLHKEKVPDNCYALDIDFALVEKNQHENQDNPFIVAIIDFKKPDDGLTFTEVLAYNQFLENDIPVYVVQSIVEAFEDKPPSEHRFAIKRYNGGDWRLFPPEYSCEVVKESVSWRGYAQWESQLRVEQRQKIRERRW